MVTQLALQTLEIHERDRNLFKMKEGGIIDLIDAESERLEQAALMLGREWIGMFNRAHVILLMAAYGGWAVGEYKREHGL